MLALMLFRIIVVLFFIFLLAGFFKRGLRIVHWWKSSGGVSWGLSFAIVFLGWLMLVRLTGKAPPVFKFLFTVSVAAYLFLELVYLMNRRQDDAVAENHEGHGPEQFTKE